MGPAGSRDFSATLTGPEVVPPTGSDGTGLFAMQVDSCSTVAPRDSLDATYFIGEAGLAGTTGAHLRRGARGANGPVVATLASGDFLDIFGLLRMSRDDCDALDRGELYVVIETNGYPQGCIRGQVTMDISPVKDLTWGSLRLLYR
jgi:hypothetical protein